MSTKGKSAVLWFYSILINALSFKLKYIWVCQRAKITGTQPDWCKFSSHTLFVFTTCRPAVLICAVTAHLQAGISCYVPVRTCCFDCSPLKQLHDISSKSRCGSTANMYVGHNQWKKLRKLFSKTSVRNETHSTACWVITRTPIRHREARPPNYSCWLTQHTHVTCTSLHHH